MEKAFFETSKMLGDANKIIIPRLSKWMFDNRQITYDEDVMKTILTTLTTPGRDRSGSFASSSAGKCQRAQIYAYLGLDQNPITDINVLNMFNDGHWRHMRLQANLLQAGIIDDIELSLNWEAKRSKGSVDAVGTIPDDHPQVLWRGKQFGLEIKGAASMKASKILMNGPDVYREQVDRYFLSGGFDFFSILVEDRNFLGWTEFVYQADPVRIQKQRDELDDLNWYVDNEVIPDRIPECRNQSGEMWRACPFGGKGGICARTNRWRDAA